MLPSELLFSVLQWRDRGVQGEERSLAEREEGEEHPREEEEDAGHLYLPPKKAPKPTYRPATHPDPEPGPSCPEPLPA